MTSSLGYLRRGARRWRRRILTHRRLLAGVLALLAVVLGLQAAHSAAPAGARLTVAAHDLPAGTTLTTADLTSVRVPPDAVPDGAGAPAAALDGRMLAAGLRRGEPVTDLRLVGPALTDGAPGLVAVPVRLPDAEMAALLRVGDHVRLLATTASDGATRVVAPDAEVLALPAGSGEGAGSATASAAGNGVTAELGGRLIVVGLREDLVTPVTSASVRDFLTYAYPN